MSHVKWSGDQLGTDLWRGRGGGGWPPHPQSLSDQPLLVIVN